MRCPLCGKELPDAAKFCGACGRAIPRCVTCGKVLQGRTRFCPVDGTPIPQEVNDLFGATPQNGQRPVQPAYPPNSPRPVQPAYPPNSPRPVQPAPRKNSSSNTVLIVLLILLGVAVLALAVIFGVRALDDSRTDGDTGSGSIHRQPTVQIEEPSWDEAVYMPDCVGRHEDSVAADFAGLEYDPRYEYAFSEDVDEGYVISQSIPAYEELSEFSDIVIVVSKGPDIAPEGYNQKVVVTAAPGSSYGTMTLLAWQDGQWKELFRCDATVGYNGISADYYERSKRTPLGTFKLGVALSANSITNRDWPFRMVTANTCIVDDVNSPYYNTIQNISSLPYGVSYDPIGNTLTKGYSNILIYIEHNGNGLDSTNVVPGKCSVITICGRSAAIAPTAGCVDISASDMLRLMSLLDYNKDPHIEIKLQ